VFYEQPLEHYPRTSRVEAWPSWFYLLGCWGCLARAHVCWTCPFRDFGHGCGAGRRLHSITRLAPKAAWRRRRQQRRLFGWPALTPPAPHLQARIARRSGCRSKHSRIVAFYFGRPDVPSAVTIAWPYAASWTIGRRGTCRKHGGARLACGKKQAWLVASTVGRPGRKDTNFAPQNELPSFPRWILADADPS
jgi:hypothetical protein